MDLIAGGMTDLQGFLDLFGRWDPSLTFVMGGAILVGSVGFALPRHPATFRTDPSNAIGGGPLSGLLGACRAWDVEAKIGPSQDSFCRIRRLIAIAMGLGACRAFPPTLSGRLLRQLRQLNQTLIA